MFGVVLSSLILCATPTQETLNEIKVYASCLNNNEKILNVIEWEESVSLYFKKEDVREALLIIYCESSGRPNAVNINRDNSTDVGLFPTLSVLSAMYSS